MNDPDGSLYAYSYLKARSNGIIDSKAIGEMLTSTCRMKFNDDEMKLLCKRIMGTTGAAITSSDFDQLLQKGRSDTQAFMPLWKRIRDEDTAITLKTLESYIRKDMKLSAVRDEDIHGYLAYIGMPDKQDIDFHDFRKM